MVGHWQFIVSKAINMCSLNLTSSIGDFSQASLPELPQRFVIPSVTSYRRWRYFCLGFLLSPFCHLLLRLQVVGRTHQARGFLNGKTTTATKPRSLVFSSGWGRSCPSELGRMGSHWVAWGGFAGLDELGVTILACVTCLFASLFLLTGSLHSLPLVRVFHPTVTRTKRTSSCVWGLSCHTQSTDAIVSRDHTRRDLVIGGIFITDIGW